MKLDQDNPRELKELYKILVKFYTNRPKNYICNTITDLYYNGKMTTIEGYKLQKHFKSQIPTANLHPEFFEHELFKRPIHDTDAWFALDKKPRLGKKVRIEFINKIISTL